MSTVTYPGTSNVTYLGVRHHSPACARLVRRTVRALRPAYVLVEGPADMNARLDELLLGHRLPVAVFSHYRDAGRVATSWAPLCDHSPEWCALTEGRAAGAEVRFIDLPAWHPAFTERPGGAANRYADAEARHAEATGRLRAHYAVDTVDALWDRLFEVADDPAEAAPPGTADPLDDPLARRLDAYFDLVRGDARADDGDRARETYMASWVRAAAAHAGDRPVLVVTGGFHQPALRALVRHDDAPADWPEVPGPPADAVAGSFLVPYSFRLMDAFGGYQSGMPSPAYYQRLWEEGPEEAARGLLRDVVGRLRDRGLPVSTADLVAARTLTEGLAALRGHPHPARVDVLDGLAGALIGEDLGRPLPWNARGVLTVDDHPVVVEMTVACTGDRTGSLHPDTPLPPLVHAVDEEERRLGLTADGPLTLDLATTEGLERSRFLHRLRVLGIPGHTRAVGPGHGTDPVFRERWDAVPRTGREAALIEAGAYGALPDEASAARLTEQVRVAGTDVAALSGLLFDAVLCGVTGLSHDLLGTLAGSVRGASEAGALGGTLTTALGLWRHDRVFGVARTPLLAAVLDGAVDRLFQLVEGATGGTGVDRPRLRALAAARDTLRYAPEVLTLTPRYAAEAAARIAEDPRAPADLRGAALGLRRSLDGGSSGDGSACGGGSGSRGGSGTAALARSFATAGTDTLGDWLTGLFALAREEVLAPERDQRDPLLDVLDDVVSALTDQDFLTGLPALRQAFAHFPPRERERLAQHLLDRRRLRGSARSLLRVTADPLLRARAAALEERVALVLDRYALGAPR
ncbi:DUF5682 family protein [Streptomyces sp. NPDC002644]